MTQVGGDPNAAAPQPLLLPVGMDLEDLEREVQILLAGVDTFEELQRICAAIALQVPQDVTDSGKVKSLSKFLLRHLNSEAVEKSADEGLGTFLKVYNVLLLETDDEDDKQKVAPIDKSKLNVSIDQMPDVCKRGRNAKTLI